MAASIVPLTQEHLAEWVAIHNQFHLILPWHLTIDTRSAAKLLDDSENQLSFLAVENGSCVAIGTLDTRIESTAIVPHFAFQIDAHHAAMILLKHLIAEARNRQFEEVSVHCWESITQLQKLLAETGFVEKNRQSLMNLSLSTACDTVPKQGLTIKSLGNSVSVEEFVAANRAAFADDTSRPLEVDEVEEWLETQPGFRPDIQLAALIDNRIVGTALSEYEDVGQGYATTRHAWIYGMGVIPTMQRQGIGTALMEELCRRLRKYGVSGVRLLTDPEGGINTFYDRLGFVHETYRIEYVFALG